MVQTRPKNSGEKDLWKLPKVGTYLEHITVYCFKFHSRFRKQGESIQHYVAESRCLSEHCDFKDHLEGMIRDSLVCEVVNDERIRRRSVAESRLDFKKAFELATAMETADKNTRDIQQGNFTDKPRESPVVHISKEQEKNQPRNVIVVEARFTKLKSADIKMRSVFVVAKKGKKPANAVEKGKGINKTVRSQETLITWKLQRPMRRTWKNTACLP